MSLLVETDLLRDPPVADLLANRSGSAGRPGGSCGFLSDTDGLPGRSGLARSGWYGRILGGAGRSVAKLFGGR